MILLGFENGYVIQGGDVGSEVARIMGVKYSSCKGTASVLATNPWNLIDLRSYSSYVAHSPPLFCLDFGHQILILYSQYMYDG